MQHILKNIRQLWDALTHIGVPADEIEVLDETYHPDGHLIKQWYWVAMLDTKECHNQATYVRANLHDAIHACDFVESFDHCL